MTEKLEEFLVYTITNLINGKRYIGITTIGLEVRWKIHTSTKSCRAIHHAINKYGKDAFTINVIAQSWSRNNLLELEQIIIKQEGTLVPKGYNLNSGGMAGTKPSEETRSLMSKASKGKSKSEEHKKRISKAHIGKKKGPFSEEAKRHMSEALKGKRRSEETKVKISIAQKKRPPRSEETRAKMSMAKKGKPNHLHSEETKTKISMAQKGKPKSKEHVMRSVEAKRQKKETRLQRNGFLDLLT